MVDSTENIGIHESPFFDDEATLVAKRVVPISSKNDPEFDQPVSSRGNPARASALMVVSVILGASGLGVFAGLVTSGTLLNKAKSDPVESHSSKLPLITTETASPTPNVGTQPKQESQAVASSSRPVSDDPKSAVIKSNPNSGTTGRTRPVPMRQNGKMKDNDADWDGANDQIPESRGDRRNAQKRPSTAVLHAVRRQFDRIRDLVIGRP